MTDLEKQMAEALRGLLNDTQHASHADCHDGPCPVREARQLLALYDAQAAEQAAGGGEAVAHQLRQVRDSHHFAGLDWIKFRDLLSLAARMLEERPSVTCQTYGPGTAVPCAECNQTLVDVQELAELRARAAGGGEAVNPFNLPRFVVERDGGPELVVVGRYVVCGRDTIFLSNPAPAAPSDHQLEGAAVPQGPQTEFVLNKLRSALSAMTTFFGMDEDEASKPTLDKARQALYYAEIVMRPLEPWERQSLEDFRACVRRWHEKAVAKGYHGVESMCNTALPYGTRDLRLVSASPGSEQKEGANGYVLVPEKATPLIREALRIGMRREVPNDELCDIRWRAAIAAAQDSETEAGNG